MIIKMSVPAERSWNARPTPSDITPIWTDVLTEKRQTTTFCKKGILVGAGQNSKEDETFAILGLESPQKVRQYEDSI